MTNKEMVLSLICRPGGEGVEVVLQEQRGDRTETSQLQYKEQLVKAL